MGENYWQLAEKSLEMVPPIKRTGIRIVDIAERYAKLLLPLKENTNHVGIMYAGSLFTLGEMTGGIIYLVSLDHTKFYPLAKGVNIKFIKPALTDVTTVVTMTEEEVERLTRETLALGKSDFEINVELKDENDKIVSLVQGMYQIRPFT